MFTTSLMAQGDLVVFPKRIVFEGKQKMHTLNLANTGKKVAKYKISFVQIRMNEDGGFENITEPDSGQYFADPFLRIYPRTVTLAPNEAQLIKIQLRKTKQLTEGEYRSHLYIRAVPNSGPLSDDEDESTKDSTSITVRLIPVFGITIPVIIRVGELTTEVNLSNLSFEMKNGSIPTLKMEINRTGNMSVYGDFDVEYISKEGEISKVGKIKGVAVYTPNKLRKCRIQLKRIENLDYKSGTLRLIFLGRRDGGNTKIAEAELRLR